MKSILYMLFLFISATVVDACEKTDFKEEAPRPQRGYPLEVAYAKTPLELMSIHIGMIESPPTPVADLPRVTEVDGQWRQAKVDDEVYNITSWFPLSEMRFRIKGREKRWVYYNKTNGYIIANADDFLKRSIHNFVSNSLEWSGYKPRIQLIYLDMSDEVELNFKAIQGSEHDVLLRGSAVLKFEDEKPEDPASAQFGSVAGVKCDVSIQAGYWRNSYALGFKLDADEQTIYENDIFIAPNQWHIHECGISLAGKRRVLALKVDHVNYQGESVHFPLQEMREINFDADLVKGASEDPYSVDKFYRAYRVPVDMFAVMHYEKVDPFKMKVVTKILAIGEIEMDGFFFRYRRLLIARGNDREHEKLSKFVADLSSWYVSSRQCTLSFYEIETTKERKSGAWNIDDLLSASPVKLGSIGSMLGYTQPAITQVENSKCMMRVVPPEEYDEAITEVDLQINLKLDLPLLKLTKEVIVQVEPGYYKVVELGKNPENNKLIMMVVKLSERVSKNK